MSDHYSLLDKLYFHIIGEGYTEGDDPRDYAYLPDTISTWGWGWECLERDDCARFSMVDDPETGEFYRMVRITDLGWRIARERNETVVASAVKAEALRQQKIVESAHAYANNPLWGTL